MPRTRCRSAPSPGKIVHYHPPGGLGVRIDSAVYQGYAIPPYLRLAGRQADRARQDARRMPDAAASARSTSSWSTGSRRRCRCSARWCASQDIIDGDYHIHWLEQFLARGGMEHKSAPGVPGCASCACSVRRRSGRRLDRIVSVLGQERRRARDIRLGHEDRSGRSCASRRAGGIDDTRARAAVSRAARERRAVHAARQIDVGEQHVHLGADARFASASPRIRSRHARRNPARSSASAINSPIRNSSSTKQNPIVRMSLNIFPMVTAHAFRWQRNAHARKRSNCAKSLVNHPFANTLRRCSMQRVTSAAGGASIEPRGSRLNGTRRGS